MSSNQDLFYRDGERGATSNIHPINGFLDEREKVLFLVEFETILQSVRHNSSNVDESFHRIINLINSPN